MQCFDQRLSSFATESISKYRSIWINFFTCVCVCVCVCVSCSVVSDSLWPPWTIAHQASLSTGILQARILPIPFSRGLAWPRDQTQVSCIARWILYHLSHQGSPVSSHCNIVNIFVKKNQRAKNPFVLNEWPVSSNSFVLSHRTVRLTNWWHHWLDGHRVWASSGSWWWTGKLGVLQTTGLQRLRQDWATELS